MNYPIDYAEANVIHLEKPLRYIETAEGTWQKSTSVKAYLDAHHGDTHELFRKNLMVIHYVTAHEAKPDDTADDLLFVWVGTEEGDVGIYWNWRQHATASFSKENSDIDYADIYWGMKDANLSDTFIASAETQLQEMIDTARTEAGI